MIYKSRFIIESGQLPNLYVELSVLLQFIVSAQKLRTPLCKISSIGEIEQRFRLN